MCYFLLVNTFLIIIIFAENANGLTYSRLNVTKAKRHIIQGCQSPPKPDFGNWEIINGQNKPGNIIPLNAVIKFRCDVGYKLSSPSPYMFCDEHWSLNNAPQCKQLCPAFYSTATTSITCHDINGANVECSDVVDGGTLSYECMPYYEVPQRSPKQLFCQDGIWSSNKPHCEPVCGKKVMGKLVVPAIGGGQILKSIEYPWIIAIYQKDNQNHVNICGGNIITTKLILTAAHCVADDYGMPLTPNKFKITAAKLYNKYQDPRDVKAQYLDVENILIHPEYKGSSRHYYADIAILTTKQLFQLGPLVQPVCVEGVSDIHLHAAYDKGEIAGWGLTENEIPSDELRFLSIPYKPQTRCEQELPSEFVERFKFEDKLCAGFLNKNMSVCNGDSGNGLVFQNREDDRYYIHGIVSIHPSAGRFGTCNLQQNSLYTKVAFYYDWIEKNIMNHQVEDCRLPMYPENGKYSVEGRADKQPGDLVFSNELLDVSCESGYVPKICKISCESSTYDMLQCQGEEKCPKPDFPQGTSFACTDLNNKIIDCSKAVQGTHLQFICTDDHYSKGPTVRTCAGGSWGTPLPECIQKISPRIETCGETTERNTEPNFDIDDDIKVMCTYASWSYYEGVHPEHLNPYLCTHIYYAFAGIWESGNMRLQNDPLDIDLGLYRRVTSLKKKNKKLRVLLSIGGSAASNSSLFSKVAAGGPLTINPFIGSTSYYLQTYGFDGLNIDWHYPEPSDKDNYNNFLRQVKAAYKDRGWLLTASVRSYPDDTGYDAIEMNKILDWVVIKTFDMYGGWNTYTGEHTGLYPSSKEYLWEKDHLNVHAAAKLWLNAGLTRNKTVISVAFYGRTVKLRDPNQHDIHAPIVGPGIGNGMIKYSEICANYTNWAEVWVDDQKSVYKYNDDQWFSYDTKDAMWIKGAYVKDQGFLGVNVWPVDADDVFGNCSRKFQLLKHLHGGLGHHVDWDVDAP